MTGYLVDPGGVSWSMGRERPDLRIMRRALLSESVVIVAGDNNTFTFGVTGEQRPPLCQQMRKNYGSSAGTGAEYMGFRVRQGQWRSLALCRERVVERVGATG